MPSPLLCTLVFGILIKSTVLPASTLSAQTNPSEQVRAMVVYARTVNDHYPLPTQSQRRQLYERVSGLFATVSYNKHHLSFKETLDDDGYFISDHPRAYYNEKYDPKQHIRGFGMFNEEILYKVQARYGTEYFSDVGLIIILGPDGGRDWYVRGVNATGYGMLGVTFTVGNKVFGKRQGQGGYVVELGASLGTPDPEDDRLNSIEEVMWNIAHEYGHWLGLGHRNPETGIYSLMVKNLHTNDRMPEYGPAPLDIFHIMQLGWLDEDDPTRVKTITDTSRPTHVTLEHIRSPVGTILARIDITGSHEQYYVSYHRQDVNLFDGVYMGQGLLIWYKRGRRVELKSAGSIDRAGKNHLDEGNDLGGLATDFFNHIRPKFTSRNAEGMTITDIRELGEQITFKVLFRDN